MATDEPVKVGADVVAQEAEGGEQTVTSYVEQALEEAGGSGRVQWCFMVALNLTWLYAALVAYFPLFGGAEPKQLRVTCDVGHNATEPCPVQELAEWDCKLPAEAWRYADEDGTYAAEFALVCDKSSLAPLLTTLYFLGFMIGVLVWGAFSDRFGRRAAFYVPLVISTIGSCCGAIASNYFAFAFARLITGFGLSGYSLTSFVWSVELLGKDMRSVMVWFPNVLFCAGQILLSPLGLAFPVWRHLAIALAAIQFIFFSYYHVILESPKWLAANGRIPEAHEVLCKIATRNGNTIHIVPDPSLGTAGKAKASSGSVLQLLDPRLRFRFMVMCIAWFSTGLAFYGINLHADALPMSTFWANIVGGLATLPSMFVAKGLIDWDGCGRRGALAGSFILGGLCLILTAAVNETWMLVLHYTGDCAIALAFAVVYIYASELFPVNIGGTAIGLQSLSARVGSMIAPFLGLTSSINPALPEILYGIPCLIAGLLSLCLPETLGKTVPSTIDDMGGVVVEEVELSANRF